jgi:hypothetical protein
MKFYNIVSENLTHALIYLPFRAIDIVSCFKTDHSFFIVELSNYTVAMTDFLT